MSTPVPVSAKTILKWGLLWPVILILVITLPILILATIQWLWIVAIILTPYSVAAPFVYRYYKHSSFDELLKLSHKMPSYHTFYYSIFACIAEICLGIYQAVFENAQMNDVILPAILIMFFSAPFTLCVGYLFACTYRHKVLGSIRKNKIVVTD